MARSTVDLPLPDSPTSPNEPPGGTAKEMSAAAVTALRPLP